MDNSKKNSIPEIRSSAPPTPMSSGIKELLSQTQLAIKDKDVVLLAELIQHNLSKGYHELVYIDEQIGGVGLHNVNIQIGDQLNGRYRIEFRHLFRSIQYVHKSLSMNDIVWNARQIVQYSCLHVENALKYRVKEIEREKVSLGVLLGWQITIHKIEPYLRNVMLTLNRIVYRGAKHSVENIDIDAHLFTPADAIAIYLICRWIGVRLLEPTGLFDDWTNNNELLESS